jgi:hypothetical protein
LVVAIKEIGLEVNADKTKYMFMSRYQNAGRNHNIKTDNSSFERVEQFNLNESKVYSGRNQEQLKLGIVCYYSVQNIFVFQFSIQKYKD